MKFLLRQRSEQLNDRAIDYGLMRQGLYYLGWLGTDYRSQIVSDRMVIFVL